MPVRGAGLLVIVAMAWLGCADVGSQVRTRAAHDFSCREDQTRIVDAEAGVYRIAGCGLEASYHCSEENGASQRCQRLYLSKAAEPEPKRRPGSTLAKSQ
jgi:hypothetical protein